MKQNEFNFKCDNCKKINNVITIFSKAELVLNHVLNNKCKNCGASLTMDNLVPPSTDEHSKYIIRGTIMHKAIDKIMEIKQRKYIPFLGGRPDRDKLINNDDLLNLEIALYTSKSLDEFFKEV